MERPHPEGAAFLITASPVPGKYEAKHFTTTPFIQKTEHGLEDKGVTINTFSCPRSKFRNVYAYYHIHT